MKAPYTAITENVLALRETSASQVMMDEHAFHVFYHRTAAPLRAYAVRVLGNASYSILFPTNNSTTSIRIVKFNVAMTGTSQSRLKKILLNMFRLGRGHSSASGNSARPSRSSRL